MEGLTINAVQMAGSAAVKRPAHDQAIDQAAAAGNSSPQQKEEISTEQVMAAVEKVNQFFENGDYGLSFSVDDETGKNLVKVTDRETGDVIRQMPSEAMLRASRAIGDLQGFLLKEIV